MEVFHAIFRENIMSDLLFMGLLVAIFFIAILYVTACDRLMGDGYE